jgi:single-strand DNA-binding protein
MPNVNHVVLAGNLCRDVELRYLPNGTGIGQTSLALNRKWRAEDGSLKEDVSFIDLTIWGKSAETLAQYTQKGDPLLVEGRLKQDSWDDKQTGQKRSKVVVVVEKFSFLKTGGGGAGQDRPARPATTKPEPAGASETGKTGNPYYDNDDDQVPF